MKKMKAINISEIPFVKHTGIVQEDAMLVLDPHPFLENHLGTIHASAQFTLAETSSGDLLQQVFQEFAGAVIPVLRKSQIKFRKPATTRITAYPVVEQREREKFREQFTKKGRAVIPVTVELRDEECNVTATATFEWFIQRIEQ
jgi:acyl-coenzyme A thioesterase PaaI-like protein